MGKKAIQLNDRLLKEYIRKTMEQMMLLESMSSDEIHSKYYSDIDKSVFDAAVKADPTSDANHAGRYVKWILGLYKRGNWKPGDSYETKDALSKFHRLRNSLEIKDINGYKSVRQLLDAVSDKQSARDVKKSGAEKVYEDGEWLVIVPHTEEASKLYGKGTKWCTAADNENYFDYYNDKGPLYINIRKSDGEKWQFHFESRSFMDAEDDPVRIKDIGLSDGLVRFYEKVCPYFKALFEYDYVGNFNEGFAAVDVDGMCNFIDAEGSLLSPGQWFDGCYTFHEGFARVILDGEWNFLDTEGNILSPDQWFNWCLNFYEGFACVKLDGKYNFIDTEGNLYDENKNLIRRNGSSNGTVSVTGNELNEMVIESLRKALTEALSVNDVYSKYYSDIDRSVFDAAVKADPTSSPGKTGRYVKWILNLYRNGSWKPGDSDETRETLFIFEKNRQRMSGKDINSYKSVYNLYQDLKPFMDNKSHRDLKREGAEKVYEDSWWVIIIPRTEEASKLYGKNTKWCTAADNNNYFDYYNNQGPLYININKITNEKFQFHFESGSFMDEEDDEIDPTEIGLSSGAVKYYESIGHKTDLLPFDKALSESMQMIQNGVPAKTVFNEVEPIGNGMSRVMLKGKYNILTRDNELLWNGLWFDNVDDFHCGYCMVYWFDYSSNDNMIGYNYIDINGNLLLKNDSFSRAESFDKGHANVMDWDDDRWILFTNGIMWYYGNLPRWMGVEGTGFRQGGSNSPGVVYYDGEKINNWDLEDFAWDRYVSDCEYEFGCEPDEDEFNRQPEDWFRDVLNDYCYAMFGEDSVNESLVENIVKESLGMLLCEAMSLNDIYSKYYSDIDKSVFDAAVKADPTSDENHAGRYVKWILGLYKKGNWKPGDSYETKDALSKFHRLRNSLEIKDINGYKSVRQLLDAVSDKKSTSEIKRSGAEKVYEDGEWLVIVPHTEEASKLYGKGTKWCTAADNDNQFDYYNKQGPLYINIRKRDGEKWQFHFGSNQFMDAEDDPVKIKDIGLSDGLVRFYEKVCPYFRALFDYDYVGNSNEGFAAVKLNGKWNFIDTEGKLLSPDQWFDDVYYFNEGFAMVRLDWEYNYIDIEGNILSPELWFDKCYGFCEGFATVRLGKRYNFIDTEGSVLSPDQWFDDAYYFNEGFARVKFDGRWYYIDHEGNLYDESQDLIKRNNRSNDNLINEALSVNDVYSKYYSDIDKSVFDAAVKADPTSDTDHAGRYVKWILGLYKRGSWKPGDSYETKDALSKFHRLRNSLEIKDINGYKSVRQLLDAVSDKQSARDVKKSGAEKVYEDGEWLVIVPHTEEVSKLYGKGTKWCTAADNDNYFDYYNEDGPLYINIRKRDGEKWQFHFESGSFMDSEDDPVRIKDIGLSDGLVRFYEKVCPYFKAFFEYDYVNEFFEGFAHVILDKKYNIIDTNGNLLSPGQWFDDVDYFHRGFAIVKLDGKYNFIDTNGNLLSPGQWFDYCDDFYQGFATVVLDEKWYYIDNKGNLYDEDKKPTKKNDFFAIIKNKIKNNLI